MDHTGFLVGNLTLDLAIFAVIELGILLALFVMIGLVIHAENLRDWMRSLLSS